MSLYTQVIKFKTKFPLTIGWRTSSHSRLIEKYLEDDEKVIYAFTAQKNDNPFDIITSCIVALTNKRILIGQKRLLFGHFITTITPDMYNDLKVKMGLLWGKIYIDTIKEMVILSNISRGALIEIENEITTYMLREKKNFFAKKTE